MLRILDLNKEKNAFSNLACMLQQKPKERLSFLQRLSQARCDQIAMLQDKDGLIGLEKIDHEIPSLYCTFVSRLSLGVYVNVLLTQTNKSSYVFSKAAFFKNMGTILQHPKEVKAATEGHTFLKRIEFYDGGWSVDQWSTIAKDILKSAPEVKKYLVRHDLSRMLGTPKLKNKNTIVMEELEQKGWHLLRLQGRTILLQNSDANIMAIKIQKVNEVVRDLEKEFKTTTYLKQHAKELDLKSSFPTPLQVTKVEGVLKWLLSKISIKSFLEFKKMVDVGSLQHAYVYQVNPKECDYFTYLHDANISDAVFTKANINAVHDLFQLLLHGVVFPQLADMFHNSEHHEDRPDKGRYIVLTNLVRRMITGSGRLTGWKEAVAYPNVRASGIADLGDRISISDFVGETERIKKYYNDTWQSYQDKTCNYLLANAMAEYQYVLLLIAGRRGCELTEQAEKAKKSAAEIDSIWLSLARLIVRNCATAASTITHQPETEVEVFLLAIVDIYRLSRQMKYWMTGEYISDVLQNKIRNDIYEKDTEIHINIDKFRESSFNKTHGCSIDGVHPDLGPVNGQEPIKEANKLFYWMVIYIFISYSSLRISLEDIHKIIKEKDLIKSEALRRKSFTHLTEKSYHAIQLALCHERLKQKIPVLTTMQESIKIEAIEHQRQYASYTIASFWRKHKPTHSSRLSEQALHRDGSVIRCWRHL